MNKTVSAYLSNFIWTLISAQLIVCLLITGNKVLFNSSLSLWLSEDFFGFEKLNMILSGYHDLSQKFVELPGNSSILIVTTDVPWFINYYLLPRKLYRYPNVEKPEDISRIPAKWIKDKQISYVLLFHPPTVRILKIGKDVTFE